MFDLIPTPIATILASGGFGFSVVFLGDAELAWQKYSLGGIAGACAFVLVSLIRSRPAILKAQSDRDIAAAATITQQHKDIVEQLTTNFKQQIVFLQGCVSEEKQNVKNAQAQVQAIRHTKHALAQEVGRVNQRIMVLEMICADHKVELPLGPTLPVNMGIVFQEEEDMVRPTFPALPDKQS